MTNLTDKQRNALAWFEQNHIGAILFENRWLCPTDIRTDEALADRFWQKIDRAARVRS